MDDLKVFGNRWVRLTESGFNICIDNDIEDIYAQKDARVVAGYVKMVAGTLESYDEILSALYDMCGRSQSGRFLSINDFVDDPDNNPLKEN